MNITEAIRKIYHFPRTISLYLESKMISSGKLLLNRNGLNKQKRLIPEIIVSLTSYPGRIEIVPGVIASLLRQTYKPDRIILWLGIEKFPERKLPAIYDRIKKCGVEIEFRKDLKSHTKYYYAMQENPNSIIITVDDDRIYSHRLIETLINSYKINPQKVSAARIHRMTFNDQGSLQPYNDWIYEYQGHVGKSSFQYFATGVGGVLYPPHILCQETFNIDVIQRICHNHDDLWLKVMEVLSGVKVVIAADAKRPLSHNIFDSQESGQYIENVVQGGNDLQTKAVIEYYDKYLKQNGYIEKVIFEDK